MIRRLLAWLTRPDTGWLTNGLEEWHGLRP
jgi:hypothetical protein